MKGKEILTLILLAASIHAIGQHSKLLPKDDSGKTPELKLFVNELKGVIKNKDSERLMGMVHPQIKFDFDEGIGKDKFKKHWKPEDKNSSLWPIMNRIVQLGGVFVKNRTNNFFDFVFPYINQIELEDGDDYFITLVVTSKDVKVREKPDQNSKVVGQLSYDIVTYDDNKGKDGQWYFIKTANNKISGYISADFAYSPVDYRMFLTKEKGKWMISCIVAGD